MDSKLFTLHTIETFWNKIKNKCYIKPANGIPKSDLSATVQSSLNKADSALQEHQDISGKQDKSTAVTHNANTAVGSTTKPAYIAANGAATPIAHSINSDVPANAKFTDTTYSDATTLKAGLMSATDKTNLNANTSARHTHSNKATLDKLTDAQLTKLDGFDPDLYLPKSGGVMTGDIDMQTNKRDILVGTQRAAQGTHASTVAGAAVTGKEPLTTGLSERKSLIGSWLDQDSVWQNILSVRHRNGWNDGPNYGFYLRSLLTSAGDLYWNKQTGVDKWQGERVLLDSTNYSSYAAKSDHTHAMITNSAFWVLGADNTAKWVRLGTLVSYGNFSNAVIRVWSGNGANSRADQNSSFEIQIKDGYQSTLSADKACGVTVYRISCSNVKVKVIPTAHDTYTVWAYLPWGYWNGNYAVYGKYKSWTSQRLIQSEEPEGTGADTAYYDQAFLTSTVAKSTEAATLTDSGWVNMTLGSYSKSGTVKYRTYGKQITITGEVILKSEIKVNPTAPQSIANTTLDFSKVKGCSGFGRSSSGKGVYVQVDKFNGDNIIDVFSIDSNIAADSTLYFTITGFID